MPTRVSAQMGTAIAIREPVSCTLNLQLPLHGHDGHSRSEHQVCREQRERKPKACRPCKNLPLEDAHMIRLVLTSQTLITKEGKLRNGILAWLKPCAQLKLQLQGKEERLA